MKTWGGADLDGSWIVSRKVDGVCVIVDEVGRTYSRKGKPLYNLDHLNLPTGVYEIYADSWERSVSYVRTKNDGKPVPRKYIYTLSPLLDRRLHITTFVNPSATSINRMLKKVLREGYEGLVLWNTADKSQFKVKNKETYDVVVTKVQLGKGRNAGRVGALVTDMGKVGTGFTDKLREIPSHRWVGVTIEVESMGLTPRGKFRHPRFLRCRFDK